MQTTHGVPAQPASPVLKRGEPDLSVHFSTYLLHEFDHLASSLQSNEESGEKRVQFFLAIATATLGIIGLSFRSADLALMVALRTYWPMIAVSLAVLFLFGLSTALRLVQRNLATDSLKFGLRAIRRRFVTREIARAHPTAFFEPYQEMRPRSLIPPKGGWLEVILLLNAAIAAVVTWAVQQRDALPAQSAARPALVAFGVVVLLEAVYVERRYRKAWRKLEELDAVSDTIETPKARSTKPRVSDP